MPAPPGICSIRRIGGGFQISNRRNSTKASSERQPVEAERAGQRDPLAQHFVDHHESAGLSARFRAPRCRRPRSPGRAATSARTRKCTPAESDACQRPGDHDRRQRPAVPGAFGAYPQPNQVANDAARRRFDLVIRPRRSGGSRMRRASKSRTSPWPSCPDRSRGSARCRRAFRDRRA